MRHPQSVCVSRLLLHSEHTVFGHGTYEHSKITTAWTGLCGIRTLCGFLVKAWWFFAENLGSKTKEKSQSGKFSGGVFQLWGILIKSKFELGGREILYFVQLCDGHPRFIRICFFDVIPLKLSWFFFFKSCRCFHILKKNFVQAPGLFQLCRILIKVNSN